MTAESTSAPETTWKCVIVVDGALPRGLVANAAAVLGAAIGARVPDLLGPDVADAAGHSHAGLLSSPMPILTAEASDLATLVARLRHEARRTAGDALLFIPFTDCAQRERTYPGYVARLAATNPQTLQYLGVALCAERRLVARHTGNFKLLR